MDLDRSAVEILEGMAAIELKGQDSQSVQQKTRARSSLQPCCDHRGAFVFLLECNLPLQVRDRREGLVRTRDRLL
ncbi:MAG: hypothetical protein GKR90_26770 [Pseudomonadales bacterium]|nr:hypothetical protein [Pseudomonadales bacterium]